MKRRLRLSFPATRPASRVSLSFPATRLARCVGNLFFLFLFLLPLSTPALAGDLTIHIGPPSVGTGGTNPTSIPPLDPIEYEVEWITKGGFESNIGITPGLLFGMRSRLEHLYVGFGGGLVISANGSGPGIYTSFGVNAAHFNAEIKQAIGWNYEANQMVSPYAIRLGMTFAIGKG